MESEDRIAQLTFIGLLLLLALMAGLALFGFMRPKRPYAFFLSFIGCWGFAFFLLWLAGFMKYPHTSLRLPISPIRQMELATIAWGICASIFVLIPLVFMIVSEKRPRRPDTKAVSICGMLGFLGALVMVIGSVPGMVGVSHVHAVEAEVKSDVHAIQIAVERYAVDHQGHYPSEIQQLNADGYLLSFPENPFSREPMRPIQVGDPDFEGNFTYEPVIVSNEVTGYRLFAYGSRENAGQDIDLDGTPDHVILVLQNPADEEKSGP
jgi:hypothetical protein